MIPKYELVENKNAFHDDHWCIKILEGTFEGLVYQYDVVKLEGDEGDEEMGLTFNTITLENPNNVDLTKEEEEGIMGSILVEIIKAKLEGIDENGTPDTEQPAT